MAKLTAKARNKIPTSKFGLPGERKFPMNDKSHAANAKARATQMVKKGKLSSAAKSKIDAKANGILGKKVNKMAKSKDMKKPAKKAHKIEAQTFETKMTKDRKTKKAKY